MLRFLILAGLATPAAAAIDLGALDRAAVQFAGAPLGAVGGPIEPIDRRLRLADCASPPAFDWRGDRHDAIVIRCPDAGGWRLFVAVKPAATPAATVVPGVSLRAEPVIRRGDLVTVLAGNNGFQVSSDGIAIGDAAPGARFGVRIEGVRTPIQAIAVEAGKATLPGW